jgi:3-hydroxyisobutyrate dehydrogenase-like beta-hydroxyacid dehydrogenase
VIISMVSTPHHVEVSLLRGTYTVAMKMNELVIHINTIGKEN